tara:strand:+ start:333 stop:1346 length:1014 start_codon:yes stop_codon:yes gene_type:complete
LKAFSQKLVDSWHKSIGIFWILWPIEVIYIFFINTRRALYRFNIFSIYRAPCPVVIVGNITIGGSGKTPVVIELAKNLQRRGLKIGVISRGYGSKRKSQPLIVNRDSEPLECGDEPLLIHSKANCPVVVHNSRGRAAQLLIDNFQPDLILSDDGLQHYNLARDLEIIMIDHQRDLGNRHCLPVGPLREPEERLQDADIILRRGGDEEMSVHYQPGIWKQLKASDKPKKFPSSSLIHAIAGIGQPEQFFSMLEGMGLSITRFSYSDHHQYQQSDFDRHAGKVVVMTEKDAVKCKNLDISDAWFIEITPTLPCQVVEKVYELVVSTKINNNLASNSEIA